MTLQKSSGTQVSSSDFYKFVKSVKKYTVDNSQSLLAIVNLMEALQKRTRMLERLCSVLLFASSIMLAYLISM